MALPRGQPSAAAGARTMLPFVNHVAPKPRGTGTLARIKRPSSAKPEMAEDSDVTKATSFASIPRCAEECDCLAKNVKTEHRHATINGIRKVRGGV